MNTETILVSILTAVVTAALVAGANHFWNRRYLFAVEREKYRQALFSEKLKAYVEITTAIHEFILFAGEVSARLGSNEADNVPQKMASVYRKLVDVKSLIHKHMLLIPDGTLDKSVQRVRSPHLTR